MSAHPLPVIDLAQIVDARARHAICELLNLVEELMTENRILRIQGRKRKQH